LVLPVYPAAWPHAKKHPLVQLGFKGYETIKCIYVVKKVGFRYRQAHEIKQPIAAARTHASAAMRWLDRSLPDPGEARKALAGIVDSANRANDII